LIWISAGHNVGQTLRQFHASGLASATD